MTHEVVVHADATTHDVWSLLADVEGWPRWTPSVRRAHLLTTPPLQIGSRVRVRQPRLAPMTWTVTELDPSRRFTWEAKRPGLRIVADHNLSPGPDETTTIRLTLEQFGVVGRALSPLTARITDRYLHLEAHGLMCAAELAASRRTGTPEGPPGRLPAANRALGR